MTERLTRHAFAGCLDSLFRVVTDLERPLELRLTRLEEGTPNPGYDVFSLVFEGAAERYLPQATYRLLHDLLGEFDLFLVPVGRCKDGFQYEAVFNRLAP